MGIATAALVVGGAMAVAGTVKAISGGKDKRKAKDKQKAAEDALKEAQDGLKNVDTSNPFEDAQNAYEGLENKMAGLDNVYEDAENVYADMENKMAGQKNAYADIKNEFEGLENKYEGMENAFEDLTVNTQQAEFEAQQMQQQQANIMSSMGAAAGGSGIAALAQSMANAGAMQAQKAAASIGAQEADNAKKAAKANQDIEMATAAEGARLDSQAAGEASRISMAQAGEQSRLDTQERQADMDIQKTQMGAEEAMQAARLGEASKLQLLEAQEAADLQMQEAAGEMEVQSLKGEGQLSAAGLEMQQQQTLMDSAMQQYSQATQEKQAGDKKMWGGIGGAISGIGKIFSDKRLKENIIKVSYSDSGIPIYHFNYKGKDKIWSGTMAQDLLNTKNEHAVGTSNGYYTVNYNLIDVDMKEIKPSPLKQLGATPQEDLTKRKAQMEAGLDILSGAQARKNWEELQLDIKDIEPESMKIRKLKDQLLRDKEKQNYETNEQISLAPAYTDCGILIVKKYKEQYYEALINDDKEEMGKVKTKLASLAEAVKVIKDSILEFYEDQFETETLLSKGVSQQQVSFATQMYCKNPELKVVYAVEEDVLNGRTDYYGELVKEDVQYCVVYDFYDNPVLINVYDGNKDMFIRNNIKATEYIDFLNQTFQLAQEANAGKSAVKIDLGRINYKIDTLFGFNDGTASKEQDELVMMFCHDSEVLRDGSTFRRHLYEHPNIQNLNYGGFDWDMLEFKMPLGPGDKGHWADNIDDIDRLLLVDAIVNVDNPFFNLKLLRTLVKEYYTYKLENAWWKGMGYEQGKLDIMRLKQKELIKARFKKAKAEASKNGEINFMFDGKVFPTGMTKAKVKKQEEERGKAAEQANPELNK